MRSQAEERERRADRKGERTGGWWAAPSLPFMMRGRWHRLIVAVRGGMRSRRLVIVICLLTSFVAVHRAPLSVVRSCPSNCLASLPCVWSWVTWRVLAVELASAVDAVGVAGVGCVHPVVVVCGFCGPWSLFGVAVCFTRLCCRCCVVMVFCWAVVVILGWLGSCHPAGFMWRYMGSTWWRSGRGLSLGGVSRLWETSLAWWLLVEE